ncbi:hypothetical protein Zmor_010310 [Zophobas morio]|uniref:Odorant receptor n=1 Tax=Zophobas morio TaxID=2755281 RepID=A0AA38INL4_9CUCU|nr:hypothetical protein Zmor_010310 [Zophobas morio]
MANIIEKSFSLNLKVLHIMGLYSLGDNSVGLKSCILYFVFLVLPIILTFINILMDKRTDNVVENAMVVYLVEAVDYCFKFLPFLYNPKKIQECINFFGDDNFAPKTDQERKIIDECIWVCRRNSFVYFCGILLALIGWHFPVFFFKGRKLPLDIWLPYDPLSTAFRYYLTLIYVFGATFYIGFCGTTIDSLVGGLPYHATAQLKILKYNLQHMDKFVDYTLRKRNEYIVEYRCVYKHLQYSINHHNKILRFLNEFEECFSVCIFSQFAGSLFGICFCCIGLTLVSVATVEGFTYIALIVDITFQIFFYCYYGTLLYEESQSLNNAIYMGPWYEFDIKTRKILLTVMERAKRPMLITVGNVVDLTLVSLLSVLKTSYSLIAVLNTYE